MTKSLREFLRRGADRLADRADRVAFANLADDIRGRAPEGYSVYVNTNEQRIIVTKKAA